MITKIIDDHSVALIPEEADDLLTIRRVIKKGDRIVGDTTRVIKQEKEYSRPDRGERVRIKIALTVEKISLDNVLDRLRIHGTIIESNNESVPQGSHHSFVIKMNEGFTITKSNWSIVEKKLIKSKAKNIGFILIAIDTGDCGIARLTGTHLQLFPNIYSGSSGKQYKTSFKIEKFFEQVIHSISSTIRKEDKVILFGPGETRKKFGNYLQNTPLGKKHQILVIEGVDSGGEDGILLFTKSNAMKEIMKDSKLATVFSIVDEIMTLANKKSRKFTMGFEETNKANQYGAIDSLVFSDKIIQTLDEDKIIDFLNQVEEKGVKIFSVDSTTDLGLRVDGLGGMVSLLRFPVNS